MSKKSNIELKELLFDIIKTSKRPISSSNLRVKTCTSWNTLHRNLEELKNQGKIGQINVPKRHNLWFKK